MSDNDRIARLTELARRVWPDASIPVDVTHTQTSARVEIDDPRASGPIPLAFLCHPRALDALEAALLVLNGTRIHVMVPPTRGFVPWHVQDESAEEECARLRERIAELEHQLEAERIEGLEDK